MFTFFLNSKIAELKLGKRNESKFENLSLKGLDLVKQYPPLELYRLVVDGRLHASEKGWIEYEKRQPGCIQAALNGLAFAFTDLNNIELTEEIIYKLYEICTSGLEIKHDPILKIRNESKRAECFGLNISNISENGLEEIFNTMAIQEVFFKKYPEEYGAGIVKKKFNKLDFSTIIWQPSLEEIKKNYKVESNKELAKIIFSKIKSQTRQEYFYLAPSAGNLIPQFKKLIIEYNIYIRRAETQDEKLSVIIQYITAFNRLHPFYDANIRTLVILLMNRLLLQHNFPMSTYFNPNIFDGLALNELIEKVKEGMEKTLDIIKGEKNSFNFKSSSISKTYQEIFINMSKSFLEKINIEIERKKDSLSKANF